MPLGEDQHALAQNLLLPGLEGGTGTADLRSDLRVTVVHARQHITGRKRGPGGAAERAAASPAGSQRRMLAA